MRAVVILQLGTPNSLDKDSVSAYLKEFLMDPKVISIPWLIRYMLVNGIIVPRRTTKVIDRYKLIWNSETGSPLRYHGDNLANGLNELLPDDIKVFHATRYGDPSIAGVMRELSDLNPREVIYVPLFPHYSEATVGSLKEELTKQEKIFFGSLKSRFIPLFQDIPKYNKIMAENLLAYNPDNYDKVLFSFHGLPLKHIETDHKGQSCADLGCSELNKTMKFRCYTRSCYETAKSIADLAGLREDQFMVSFQSRFGKRWIGPQSEDIVAEIARSGKSLLIIAPSFMTDCLETSWEIGISFRQLYEGNGGEKFEWVPSLNSDPDWIKALGSIIMDE